MQLVSKYSGSANKLSTRTASPTTVKQVLIERFIDAGLDRTILEDFFSEFVVSPQGAAHKHLLDQRWDTLSATVYVRMQFSLARFANDYLGRELPMFGCYMQEAGTIERRLGFMLEASGLLPGEANAVLFGFYMYLRDIGIPYEPSASEKKFTAQEVQSLWWVVVRFYSQWRTPDTSALKQIVLPEQFVGIN